MKLQRRQLAIVLVGSALVCLVAILERALEQPALAVLQVGILCTFVPRARGTTTLALACTITVALGSAFLLPAVRAADPGQDALIRGAVLVTTWWIAALQLRDLRASPRRSELRRLRESNERFRDLVEHLREVFWITTADGHEMIYVSPAYEDIWGRSCETLYREPTNWLDAIHPGDRERVAKAFASEAARGTFNEQYRIRRPDGTERWIHDRGFPVRDEDGTVYRIAGLAEDITERKQSEEALTRKQRQLLRSERLAAIGEMMTGLAHESRNALQRSQACLDMLYHRIQDRPRALDLLGRIQDAQEQLFHLYEGVREYAAPMRLQYEACDLHQVASRAWRDLAIQRKTRTAHLRCRTNGVSSLCQADRFALREVFVNTFSNALAACADPVELTVSLQDAELESVPAVSISVADNGPGLSQEERERAFEPFYTTNTKGTGLGLAIVQRIAEAHRGTVQLGAPTRGAEVIITLPRGEPER